MVPVTSSAINGCSNGFICPAETDRNQVFRSEQQWYKSMEELIPDFERYGIRLSMEAHPYDFVELHDRALELVRSVDKDWLGYEYCCPHTFHLSDGAGDAGRMIRTTATAGKLREVHVSDAFNHRANDGNRYIVNPSLDRKSVV